MRYYVSRPTSARCVEACHTHGFGVLLSPLSVRPSGRLRDMSAHVHPLPGLPFVIDNGAWACHQAGVEWSPEPMLALAARLGLAHPGGYYREGLGRGFAVLPDIVGGGQASLDRSLAFRDAQRNGPLSDSIATWLLAVQDGMDPETIAPLLERYHLGLFVGGSREWKWQTAHLWAEIGLDLGVHVHVGRVNGLRRAQLCRDLGIQSCDGSSVSQYADNAPKMARAHDGIDVQLPRPGVARETANMPTRARIAAVEPLARATIARRRLEVARETAVAA